MQARSDRARTGSRRLAAAWLAWLAVASQSGCAVLASANAHHNSRGTACIETPTFAIIDLLVGGATAAALVTGGTAEDSPGWLVVPGVFFASGILGSIGAYRCQGPEERGRRTVVPANNTAPSFGDAPVDPAARPATAEEMGIVPLPQAHEPSLPASAPRPTLRLDPDYDIDKGKPAPAPGQDASDPPPLPCGDAPGACPPRHSCAIAGARAGYCVEDR